MGAMCLQVDLRHMCLCGCLAAGAATAPCSLIASYLSSYTSDHIHVGSLFGSPCTLIPPFVADKSGARSRATQDIQG